MKKLMTLVLAVCMLLAATTAFAAEDNFTPSVTAKPLPGILEAWIEEIETGKIIKALEINKDIIFTAVSEALEAGEEDAIAKKLVEAYNAILGTASLADLGLEGAENMIVRDLFQISLVDVVIEEGQVLKVKFEMATPDAFAISGIAGWGLGLADKILETVDKEVIIEFPEATSTALLVEVTADGVAVSPAT